MKNLFHKGLYAEGLRRGRLLGILFTCLFSVYAVFYPINRITDAMKAQRGDYGLDAMGHVADIGGVLFNPLYVLVFCVFVPFLALSVFSFLNKRNTSDFYHSLPHKRQTIYISYGLSILTWVLFSILVTALIELVVCFFGAKYVMLNFFTVGIYLLMIFVAAILVLGALMISMAITGTTFTNICTALLILFLPRLLIYCFTNGVASLASVVDVNSFPFLLNLDTNLLFSLLDMFMRASDRGIALSAMPTVIYTLVLGMVYLAIGGILFLRRKSESAGNAALNNVVQTAIRVSISFFICVIPCMMILDNNRDAVWIAALYCIALLVYFVYEVISTKKISNVKRALPGLLVLLAMNLVFLGGVQLGKNIILSQDWRVEKISGIVLMNYNDYAEVPAYETLRLQEMTIQNPELKQLVSIYLRQNQEEARTHRMWENMDYRNMMLAVKKTDGQTVYRLVFMPEKDIKRFQSILLASDEMKQAAGIFPENPQSIQINAPGKYSAAQCREIYNTFYQEVQELDRETQLNINGYNYLINRYSYESTPYPQNDFQLGISVGGTYNGKRYGSYYTVSRQTPKTLVMILEIMNKDYAQSLADLKESLKKDYDEEGNYGGTIELRVLTPDERLGYGGNSVSLGRYGFTKEKREQLIEMLETTLRKNPDGSLAFTPLEDYLFIYFSIQIDGYYESYNLHLPVTGAARKYIDILGK